MDRYRHRQRDLARMLRYDPTGTRLAPHTPITGDHVHNPARGLTSVHFVPPKTAQRITDTLIAPLRAVGPDHYYLPPTDLHVTIKNVRVAHDPPRFTAEEAAEVAALFAETLSSWPTFELLLDTVTPFATSLALTGTDDGTYTRLVMALDESLRMVGLRDDKLYIGHTVYFPSLTLARYTTPPDAAFLAQAEALKHALRLRLPIDRVTVVCSNSVCPAGGRQEMGTFPLVG